MIAHPDTMHTKHGGSDAYLYGSVLKYIVKDLMPSANEKENLSVFWTQLKDSMKNDCSSNRFADLTLTMFDNGNDRFPILKGRAAQIRHLGRPLLECFRRICDASRRVDRIIIKAMEASVAIDDVINETIGHYTIEEPRWTQMVEACDAYTLSVTALRGCLARGRCST